MGKASRDKGDPRAAKPGSHLNLTRTLADAWGLSETEVAKARHAIANPPEPYRIPYAGKPGRRA